jgi:hypothetical protein
MAAAQVKHPPDSALRQAGAERRPGVSAVTADRHSVQHRGGKGALRRGGDANHVNRAATVGRQSFVNLVPLVPIEYAKALAHG